MCLVIDVIKPIFTKIFSIRIVVFVYCTKLISLLKKFLSIIKMNEHLRKLYLMATRNSDFVTQRNISKYLPMKNDLVNYEGILELNKNLAEV